MAIMPGSIMPIRDTPEVADFYAKHNIELLPSGQEAMRKFQREEIERWKRIAVTTKIEQQ